MTRIKNISPTILVGLLLWTGSLALYVSTLAPSLSWGVNNLGLDGGELLAAAKTFGVPHPPGYPTYTLLLRAFAFLIPIGDFAYRGNLMSAVLASFSVVLLYAFTFRLARLVMPVAKPFLWIGGAVLGASAFTTSSLFWSQATITEVYTLNTFFASALLLLASYQIFGNHSYEDGHNPRNWAMVLFAFVLGIGLGNHLTLLAIGIPLVLWVGVTAGWRSLLSWRFIGAFLLGIGIYVYLPISASQNPPVNWGDADTFRGMAWMLTGQAYQDYLFGVPPDAIPHRLKSIAQITFAQFNPLGMLLAFWGVWYLASRQRAFLAVSTFSVLTLVIYSLNFSTADYQVLLIPAFMISTVWIGVGFSYSMDNMGKLMTRIGDAHQKFIGRILRRAAPAYTFALVAVVFAALPLTMGFQNYTEQNLRDDIVALQHAREIVNTLPHKAIVLSSEEGQAFAIWYMVHVEGVEKELIPIAIPLLQYQWYRDGLSHQYPHYISADLPSDYYEAVRSIVQHNRDEAGVFLTYRDHILERELEMVRVGKLFSISETQK